MLSCSPENASELFQLEKSHINSCSKSKESEDAESRYDFYSTYCDFDYQSVFNSSSNKKETHNLHNVYQSGQSRLMLQICLYENYLKAVNHPANSGGLQ